MVIFCVFDDSLLASRDIFDQSPDNNPSAKKMAQICIILSLGILSKTRFICIKHVYQN